jgi:hypothetical protein
MEQTERQPQQDPQPVEDSDAERVTEEEADRVPSGEDAQSEGADSGTGAQPDRES